MIGTTARLCSRSRSNAGPLPVCDLWQVSGVGAGAGRQRQPRGFTLMELMIVMAIGAILLATGLPPFIRAAKKEGIRKAVSDVVEACSHARAQAILKGVPTELVIRAEDGSISVQALRPVRAENAAPADIGLSEPAAPAQIARWTGRLAEDVAVNLIYVNFQDAMEYPEARVRFFPNGTCDEFTMILMSPTGEQKISLDVVTALADVEVLR